MKNNDRIVQLIKDLKEWQEECRICFEELENAQTEQLRKLIYHSVRAYFLDLHILCEDFISINLKELKKFKIDISAIEGMEIIRDAHKISDEFYEFYAVSRRLRNRLAHRYKLPKDIELLLNIQQNYRLIEELITALKDMVEVK